MVNKICTSSFTIGPCCHIQSFIIGVCHLVQIRVCSNDSQPYIFSTLRKKAELIHWSHLRKGPLFCEPCEPCSLFLLPQTSWSNVPMILRRSRNTDTHICVHVFLKRFKTLHLPSNKMVVCNWKLFCIPPNTAAPYKSGLILIIIVLPTTQACYWLALIFKLSYFY